MLFNKNLLSVEKMEEIIKDYKRVYNTVMVEHGTRLILYYNSVKKFSAKEIADIVGEKIAMLTKIRFEHDLRNIYNPYE